VDQGMLQALAKSTRRGPLWTPDDRARPLAIGRGDIKRLIPHREPFLFVDEITEVDLDARALRGRRWIDPEDPVFQGHFPGRPIYPGVLQLEIIGQAGLCLLHFISTGSTAITPETTPRDARAVRIHAAQFQAPVGPDDDLTIICQAVEVNEYTGTCAGQVWRGGTLCSSGLMEVYFVDA